MVNPSYSKTNGFTLFIYPTKQLKTRLIIEQFQIDNSIVVEKEGQLQIIKGVRVISIWNMFQNSR